MDRVAVVILNYNGATMLRRFLPAVLAHSAGAAIVVADNGSTDASIAVVKEQFPTVRIIELGHNYGFAEGYNRALAQVEADYFLLLNSDVEVTAGWLQPLLAFMDANAAAVACQPKVLSFNNKEYFVNVRQIGSKLCRLERSEGFAATCSVPDISASFDLSGFLTVRGCLNFA